MYDAVIIGGGPAGASCAEELAKKGFSCLLLEKSKKKRYKACAGGLSLEAYNLKPLPPCLVERKIVLARIFSPSHSVEVGFTDDAIEGYLEHSSPLSWYEKRWKKELYEEDLKYAQKLQNLLYGHGLSDQLVEAVVEMARTDEDVRTALRWLLNKKEPRKTVYNILLGKKFTFLRKLRLSSVKLLPRLV
jgi:flavin-dependent dehydrogenase